MAEVASTRALEELKQVIREMDLEKRIVALADWGERWYLQVQAEISAGEDPRSLSDERRASVYMEAVKGMVQVAVKDGVGVAVEVQPVDERSERLVLSVLRGRPNLAGAPDAVVIPFRPRST